MGLARFITCWYKREMTRSAIRVWPLHGHCDSHDSLSQPFGRSIVGNPSGCAASVGLVYSVLLAGWHPMGLVLDIEDPQRCSLVASAHRPINTDMPPGLAVRLRWIVPALLWPLSVGKQKIGFALWRKTVRGRCRLWLSRKVRVCTRRNMSGASVRSANANISGHAEYFCERLHQTIAKRAFFFPFVRLPDSRKEFLQNAYPSPLSTREGVQY